MRIEPLSFETDSKDIFDFTERLFKEIIQPDYIIDEHARQKILIDYHNNSCSTWSFCAKKNDQIIALFNFAESFGIFAKGNYIIINELYVAVEERGKGIGTEIIRFIEDFCAKKNYQRIDVASPSDERFDSTFNFYKRNGYNLSGKKLRKWI